MLIDLLNTHKVPIMFLRNLMWVHHHHLHRDRVVFNKFNNLLKTATCFFIIIIIIITQKVKKKEEEKKWIIISLGFHERQINWRKIIGKNIKNKSEIIIHFIYYIMFYSLSYLQSSKWHAINLCYFKMKLSWKQNRIWLK